MARWTEDLTLDLAEGVMLLVVGLVVCLRLGLELKGRYGRKGD